jgi:hypothetical protein
MRRKRILLYPLFLCLATLVTDYFWRNIFEDLSYGICPYGTYIREGTIYCNIKDKYFSYSFVGKPPDEVVATVIHLFKTKLSVTPSTEYVVEHETMEKALDLFQYKHWKDIKRKNIKDILLTNYIIARRMKEQLSLKKAQHLATELQLGFMFKTITNDDIVYDFTSGQIKYINGL